MHMRGWVRLWLAAVFLSAAAAAHAQSEPGRAFLLVAHPSMADPGFSGTVVLVVREGEGGPLGVILNRPTTLELREVYPGRRELAERSDIVYFGGPVQPDSLLAAFRSATRPPQGLNVVDDIYLSGFSEVIYELFRHPENATMQRFFVGYSGWAEGQLESEIALGGWYVLPLDTAAIFDMNPLTLYDALLKRATAPRLEARLHGSVAADAHP